MGKHAIGLELGDTGVRVALVSRARGRFRLEGALVVPLEKLSARGVALADPRELAQALANELQQARLSIQGATLGVAGQDAILRYTHAPPVPPWRLKLIMDLEIEDVALKRGEEIAADFQLVHLAREVDQPLTVMLALAQARPLEQRLAALQEAGIGVDAALPTALAAFERLRAAGAFASEETVLALDLGPGHADLVLAGDDTLYFARSLGAGTARIEAPLLAAGAHPPFHGPGAPDHLAAEGGWGEAARLGAAGLAGLIESTLRFARQQLKRPELAPARVLLLGESAAFPGWARYLETHLSLSVAVAEPLVGLETPPALREALSGLAGAGRELDTTVGLAIAQLGPQSPLNLLPPSHKRRRHFLTRTRFTYAACALVALGITLELARALHGLGAARRYHAALTERQTELAQRRAQLQETEAALAALTAQCRGLAETTRPAEGFADLLALIREKRPPALGLTALELKGGDAKTPGVTASLALMVDDAEENAGAQIEAFARALQGQAAVRAVRILADRLRRDTAAGRVHCEMEIDLR